MKPHANHSNYRIRTVVEWLTVVAVVAAPVVANAFPRDFAVFSLGIRSAGMGETGTADYMDVANVAHNPAIVSMRSNVQATWSTSEVSYLLADIKLDGIVAGGGYQWGLNETWSVGGGLAAGYAKERWGWKGNWGEDPPRWGPYHQVYNFAGGAVVEYRDVVRLGVGLDAKWWRYDNASEDIPQILEATLLDAGFDLSAVLLRKNGYTLAAAGGFAYFNFGGTIKTIEQSIFLPGDDDDDDPPQIRRYGLNVQFESPSWGQADDKFEATLPVVSVAFNYDLVDEVFESNHTGPRYHVGYEIGLFRALFLRQGRISQTELETSPDRPEVNVVDTTIGGGIAITYRRYHFRFDYARHHFDTGDAVQDRYGLTFDVSL